MNPKKQIKQVTQESQQSKEEGMDVAELQKKLASMVKKVKDEQVQMERGKRRAHFPPPPPSLLSRGNEIEVNQGESCREHYLSGQISKLVAGRIQSQQQSPASTLG